MMRWLSAAVRVADSPARAAGRAAAARSASAATAAVALVVVAMLAPPGAGAAEETITFGRFGTVHLYAEASQPEQVVLFVSGDGGWNQGVVDMARELAGMKALVAGIDITHYLQQLGASAEKCSYPAADFEALSQFLQKGRGFPTYRKPVLVGYSSGATLVYAVIVQAPPTTFKGAISLGFCPDLPLAKPFCAGSGLESQPGPQGKGLSFLPAAHLEVPWIALQGTIDQVCDAAATAAYVRKVPGAELVMLPKVGHGYSVPRRWLPQFRDAYARVVAAGDATEPPPASVASLADLPLVEVHAAGGQCKTLALHLTGDGGFGVTDKEIAQALSQHGVPVVVLNSLHYFWTARTPDRTAADVGRILRHYLDAWKADDVVLVGYSRGADVLPFVVNRLPVDLRARVRVLVLLGASAEADFEFHLSDWIASRAHSGALPVLPELEKLRGMRILCFYGTEDSGALAPRLDPGLATVVGLESGHRFGSNTARIVERILAEVGVQR